MSSLVRLRKAMEARNIPAIFVSDVFNLTWLTGFSGSFGGAIVTPDDAVFLTDSRYRVQANEQVENMRVETFASPVKFIDFIKVHINALGVTKLAFEAQQVTYSTFEHWRDNLGIELESYGDVVSPLRKVKTPEEVEKIKAACAIADACFTHVLRMIRPGVSEYDLALDMEFFMRRQGAEIAFDIIAASGWRGALPHGRASQKIVEAGDLITFDFGAKINGYNSDITRTVAVGEPDSRQREVYEQVLKAQLASLDVMKPGMKAHDVDAKAREVFAEKGMAEAFGHGLGHGLGLNVHDPGRLGAGSDDILEPGQVWTVEPGVYFDGWGGVRIEDDVVVTENGIEILTHAPKELLIL